MSHSDYLKGQDHAHYGFGRYQNDYDYRCGYNEEIERQEMEQHEYYQRQQYERDMEELMIEEEMQRQMNEEAFINEIEEFLTFFIEATN